MRLVEFNGSHGKVAIPVNTITGICETSENTFLSTGADNADGGENGWYVTDSYETVKAILEALPDSA